VRRGLRASGSGVDAGNHADAADPAETTGEADPAGPADPAEVSETADPAGGDSAQDAPAQDATARNAAHRDVRPPHAAGEDAYREDPAPADASAQVTAAGDTAEQDAGDTAEQDAVGRDADLPDMAADADTRYLTHPAGGPEYDGPADVNGVPAPGSEGDGFPGEDPSAGPGPGPAGLAGGGTLSAARTGTGALRNAARLALRPASRRRANWRWAPAMLFAAVTILPSLLVMAWLIPGLPLLLAGRFAGIPMIVISVPLAVALIVMTLRELPSAWPHGIRDAWDQSRAVSGGPGEAAAQPERGSGEPGPGRDRPPVDVPWWALAGTLVVAAGFAVWQLAENSQQIIVLRDPATYLQFAYWIAGHGSTHIPESLQAFGGAHQGLTFSSLGFFQVGSSVVPQFMAGLPMVLGIGVWAGGPLGAAAMAPILGALAILSFAGLAGRLVGARWAPAAALVLAVCLPEQYTSRATFSETLAQLMLYGGLCMLADSFVLTGGRHVATYPGPSSWRDGPAPNVTLAFFGGLSIGLTLLIRIDGLSDLLPALPFLGVLLVRKRPQGVPFGIGLFIGAAYGFADGYLLSRPYLDSIGPSLRPLAMIALGVLAVTVVGMGLLSLPRTRSWLRALVRPRPVRWLPEAVAALTVLALIGFAARPYFQKVRGETDPATISYIAELQKLAHVPIDPTRTYAEDSLYWVIWYIGVPAVILGAIGIALLSRRCLRALLTWRDNGAARIWALPLMIIGWVTVTVLWRPGIIADQPWASRRLVPVVLPGLILAAVWASAWIKERGRLLGASHLAGSAVAVCCVLALLIPGAVTTFGVGTTKTKSGSTRLTAHGLALKRTGAGEEKAVRELCGNIGPNASVIIVDSLTADRFSQVIRSMCATPTARMDSPTAASVAADVASIERAGRRPVLLAGQQSQLAAYGGSAHEVLNLLTTQDAHELTSPPSTTWLIHFVIWMSEPSSLSGGAVAGQAAEYSRRA
jgi:hypothetical protein